MQSVLYPDFRHQVADGDGSSVGDEPSLHDAFRQHTGCPECFIDPNILHRALLKKPISIPVSVRATFGGMSDNRQQILKIAETPDESDKPNSDVIMPEYTNRIVEFLCLTILSCEVRC